MPSSQTAETPLNEVFQDDWYKFTENTLDSGLVGTILVNRYAPANAPHSTSVETLEVACGDFLAENGDALLQALEHLKKN